MTPTELSLIAVYKSPVIPLLEISKKYLNLGPEQASRKAALNELPFAAFRMTDSRKAPWMVKTSDLAAHIDRVSEKAQGDWSKSQVEPA